MPSPVAPRSGRGRPEVTTHAEIEQAAFRLFADRGFAKTTLEAIAQEVGVGRRTLFRYYQSKNDIPWGQFDRTLIHFRELLAQQPSEMPIHAVVHQAVVSFNDFPPDAHPTHKQRMHLILNTPELQAHSVLRYAQWRQEIAAHVAGRVGGSPDDLIPQVAGHVSLAISLTAYDQWLAQPGSTNSDLLITIDEAMLGLRAYLSAEDRP